MNSGSVAQQPAQGVNQMLEIFKMQYLMKFMDGSQGGSKSLLTILVLMGWDQFARHVPILIAQLWGMLFVLYTGKVEEKSKGAPIFLPTNQAPPPEKTIKAVIQFERNPQVKVLDTRIEAVMHHVCALPEVRSLRYNGIEMIPNFKDALMIDNDVWFEIMNPQSTPVISTGGSETRQEPILYRLSTYDHDITWLHKFVDTSIQRYEQDKRNKMGSETYYFDMVSSGGGEYRNPLPTKYCIFTKSKFTSNRTLNNVYLRQIGELTERVQFFMKRRDWYDAKGIPHTLGIVMYGVPGCGKTSTIKAIANETKRHVFNLMLSEIKTKDALKELFYNETIHVSSDGKTDVLNIPLKNRLYVIEDIDAMDSVVIKRSTEDKEKEQQQKIKIAAEVELLRQTQGEAVAKKMMEGKQDNNADKLDLATLLNVLDGVRETPGRIIILSTNYPERLDEALLRPGRFDMMLEFEKHSCDILQMHLEKHYDITLSPQQLNKIQSTTLHHKWTPAEVSQILFRRVADPNAAIDDLVNEDPKKLFKFSQVASKTEEEESLGTLLVSDEENEPPSNEVVPLNM
jgi:shikimate kinase